MGDRNITLIIMLNFKGNGLPLGYAISPSGINEGKAKSTIRELLSAFNNNITI